VPRRRSIRSDLRDGIEAALYADSEVLANYKPRTVLGLIVRALVLKAGRGKMTALAMIMQIIDWDSEDAGGKGSATHASNSLRQGISQGILKKVARTAGRPALRPPIESRPRRIAKRQSAERAR